jgi:hypothetical protein
MRAIQVQEDLTVRGNDVDTPRPGQGQALVRVQAAGVCGTPGTPMGTGTCVSSSGGSVEGNFSPATVTIAPVNFGEFDIQTEGGPTQTTVATATITVDDLTGANQGWTVTLYATNFDAPGAPTQIPANDITINGASTVTSTNSIVDACGGVYSSNSADECSGTSPLYSAFAVGLAGNVGMNLASPGQVVGYACDGTGGGQSDITVPLALAIPSEVLPGSYVNTFTAQLYVGPALNNTVCSTLVGGRVGPTTETNLGNGLGFPVDWATNLMHP